MPSFAHKKLIERVARIDGAPDDAAAYGTWIEAGEHLALLRDNAAEDELIVYASGHYTFIHAAVVSNDKLAPVDQADLVCWSGNPFSSVASYVSGSRQDGIWIERDVHHSGAKTLEGAKQLVFGRTFEGFTGSGRAYFEVLQEYAHLLQIHWRPEQRAYCRFDEHGDLDHVVSITLKNEDERGVTLASFKHGPLEEYLAVSNCALVRMFDFTLLRHAVSAAGLTGPKVCSTKGTTCSTAKRLLLDRLLILEASKSFALLVLKVRSFSAMEERWFGQREKQYVEFIAQDWRNNRITMISTDPAATTNYFEAHANSLPYELSPAFFRPEVLLKYKGDRDKYTVGPREIRCRGAWSLRGYDVNEAGQVHAYICYLRDLPYAEQLHWASYNEPPKAPISKRAVTNDFKGEVFPHIDPLQRVLSIATLGGEGRPLVETTRCRSSETREHTPHDKPRRMGRGVLGPFQTHRRRIRGQNHPCKAG